MISQDTKLKGDAWKKLQKLHDPPKQLYIRGDASEEIWQLPWVAVVGARKATPYGKEVARRLSGELARAGVVIVSGLALGIDSIAHQAALDNGGKTIAVLPSGIERIYPASHAH